jgi:hypothetical protein
VATRPTEAPAMATPNRSLAAGATRGCDARGLPPHHCRDHEESLLAFQNGHVVGFAAWLEYERHSGDMVIRPARAHATADEAQNPWDQVLTNAPDKKRSS